MSPERASNNERQESFQRPVRRYFRALGELDSEIYHDLYFETQKIYQHEMGISYEEWIKIDGENGYKLLHKLGLPTQDEYEHDHETSICRAADMVVSQLGPLVESRVRSFDDLWEITNSDDSEDAIDFRDMGVWYLNACRGAMAVYEKYGNHTADCMIQCRDGDNCPVEKLAQSLTMRSIYDGDSQTFVETDEEVSLNIYRQKMCTAHELGLISKEQLDDSQRWTK